MDKFRRNTLWLSFSLFSLFIVNPAHATYENLLYSGTDATGEKMLTVVGFKETFVDTFDSTTGASRGLGSMASQGGPSIQADKAAAKARNDAKKKRECNSAKLQLETTKSLCRANAAISAAGLASQCPDADYSITVNISVDIRVVSGGASGTISIPKSTNCRADAKLAADAANLWCDYTRAAGEQSLYASGGACDGVTE